jgi:23S rRNA (cytosine1962-C5)-methyltransferase
LKHLKARSLRAPDPQVQLTRRGAERWKSGHPWIYQTDVQVPAELEGGEVVAVVDGRGWFLGKAFYSRHSKISLRWLTYEDVPIDESFFLKRIQQADQLRRRVFPGEDVYRAVHSDADLLPGLIVDRYGPYLSAQFLVKATDARKDLLAELLIGHFDAKGLVNRSDTPVRTLEGLDPQREVLRGEVPSSFAYHEGAVLLTADLLEGQKTGAFLDQRENHIVSANFSSGEALDCFSYAGGFALQLASRAKNVTAVEISESAIEKLKQNAAANQITNLEAISANAFDYLRDAVDAEKRYDTIVLDPPSFAKRKAALESAVRGYKEINLRALQLLNPGGYLITSSCSHHVSAKAFEELLRSAAADSSRRVEIVEKRGAARDHPVLLNLPETEYLKCFIVRMIE